MKIDPRHIPEHWKKLMPAEARAELGDAGRTMPEIVAAADGQAEVDIQRDIAAYLRLHEIEFIWPDPRKKSKLPEGWPDFTFAYHGVPLGLEVKTPTGKVRPEQTQRHEAMTRDGWRVHVVRGVPDVQAIFRALDLVARIFA